MDFVDGLKGGLILAVIVGHMIRLDMDNSYIRQCIYFTHMPLFFAVSGLLVGVGGAIGLPWVEFAHKQWRRVLLPWLLAFGVYTSIWVVGGVVSGRRWSGMELIEALVYPWYHLWFIPALLLMVVVAKLVESVGRGRIYVLSLSIVVSVGWLLGNVNHVKGDGVFRYWLIDKRFIYMFVFFYLAYCIIKYKVPERIGVSCRWLFVGIMVTELLVVPSIVFFVGSHGIKDVAFVIVNLCLAIMISLASCKYTGGLPAWIGWLGCNTLPIYLWHVVPILSADHLVKFADGPLLHILLSTLGVVCLLAALYWLDIRTRRSSSGLTRMLVFGK